MRKLNVTSARPRARFAQSSKFCKRRDFALKIKPRLMSGKTEEIKTVKSSNAAAVKAVKAAEMTMRLRVNDVTYVPPGSARQTLSSLTFSLPRNGLVLVVGRSGAGKSTLLNLIGGLAEPTSGTIKILDADAADDDDDFVTHKGDSYFEGEDDDVDKIKDDLKKTMIIINNSNSSSNSTSAAERTKKVGLCFQFPERHFLGRTILEELTFGWPQNARSFRLRRELAEVTKKALKAVNMEEYPLDAEVKTLSGGYKRRLALACQLARDPKVLCLDEPLAGLDWKSRFDVAKVLEKLKRERLIVVVTHDVEEMRRIADEAYRVKDGGLGIERIDGFVQGSGARTNESFVREGEFGNF